MARCRKFYLRLKHKLHRILLELFRLHVETSLTAVLGHKVVPKPRRSVLRIWPVQNHKRSLELDEGKQQNNRNDAACMDTWGERKGPLLWLQIEPFVTWWQNNGQHSLSPQLSSLQTSCKAQEESQLQNIRSYSIKNSGQHKQKCLVPTCTMVHHCLAENCHQTIAACCIQHFVVRPDVEPRYSPVLYLILTTPFPCQCSRLK